MKPVRDQPLLHGRFDVGFSLRAMLSLPGDDVKMGDAIFLKSAGYVIENGRGLRDLIGNEAKRRRYVRKMGEADKRKNRDKEKGK